MSFIYPLILFNFVKMMETKIYLFIRENFPCYCYRNCGKINAIIYNAFSEVSLNNPKNISYKDFER